MTGYKLILFVAGDEPNSLLARANLTRLCANLDGVVDLQVIDVFVDSECAVEHGVLVTPCLVLLEPRPRVLIAGTLADLRKVRTVLRLGDGVEDV